MPAITFTQYVRPHGTPQTVSIDRPEEVARKAMAIIARGLNLECEVLTTGQVSFTVTHPVNGDLAFEFSSTVHHGVGDAVDRLITRYHASLNA